jgi:V8-like Glu-specific endopeptidase
LELAMAGDPATFPFNSVVLIESPNPDGDGYLLGSGVVIGPHTILTASHVVYDITEQTALKDIHLYPGWESADPALGPGNIPTTDTDHFNEIGAFGSDSISKGESGLDFAVIDTSYTFSGWMGVLLNYPGGTVNVTGYPASAGGFQSNGVGTVSEDPRSPVLDYGTLSVSPGNSGGPLWLDSIGSDDVVGLVSTSGWASQLTTADWVQIDSWVSEDGYSLGANVSPVVTAVSSPSLVEGQSIAASSLIASISNPSGDHITEDIYEDLGGGSGFFTVNGVRQPDGVWISASPSEDVRYVVGSSPGSDTLGVGVHDATTNSNFSTSLDATAEAEVADGKAFTLLFQNSNGQAAIWDLSGAIVTGSGLLGANPGPNWSAVGTGDFNDDTLPDLLLQNTNGAVAIWETNGTHVTSSALVANPGANWKAVATGDFNDD